MDKLKQKQEKIARRILGLLEEKGWTQQELADKIEMKKSYMSAILHAERNLTLDTITRLEEALKAPLVTVL